MALLCPQPQGLLCSFFCLKYLHLLLFPLLDSSAYRVQVRGHLLQEASPAHFSHAPNW